MAGAWIEHATQGFSVPRSTTELPGRTKVGMEAPKGKKENYKDMPKKVNESLGLDPP